MASGLIKNDSFLFPNMTFGKQTKFVKQRFLPLIFSQFGRFKISLPYRKLPPHRTCVFSCAAKPRRMSLKRNLRFSGTGFFFSKDLLLFSTEKSFFVFVLITFFSSKDLLYFFHIKKVFSFFF